VASATGPDLANARMAVENLMDDACVITASADGRDGALWDHDTGERITGLEDPAATVYDASSTGDGERSLADADHLGGKCKIRALSTDAQPKDTSQGGAQFSVDSYMLGLPWDAPAVPRGATVTITSSRRDPQEVGQTFTAQDSFVGTMLVGRKVQIIRQGVKV
jgi:hypothetical protein